MLGSVAAATSRGWCSLPGAPLRTLLRTTLRPILTVDVYNPRDSTRSGGGSQQAEIVRAEEIAMSKFNKLVREEQAIGSIRQGGRRM
jgi:hypothetical protein